MNPPAKPRLPALSSQLPRPAKHGGRPEHLTFRFRLSQQQQLLPIREPGNVPQMRSQFLGYRNVVEPHQCR